MIRAIFALFYHILLIYLLIPLLIWIIFAHADPIYAPYVDITLQPLPTLAQLGKNLQINRFILGFIVTGNQPCVPAWGGIQDINKKNTGDLLKNISQQIQQIKTIGGDVAISFGGAHGITLAQSCANQNDLINAYQQVIQSYSINWIDLDLEGSVQFDQIALQKQWQAIQSLQKKMLVQGKKLNFTLTIPITETGLTQTMYTIIEDIIINQKVILDQINIMTMNYGHALNSLSTVTINSAHALYNQLKTIYSNQNNLDLKTSIWQKIGITPMIGINDTPGEIFTLEDARIIANFAHQINLGLLSMWSLNRDNPCSNNSKLIPDPNCSGIQQKSGDFSRIFN